MKLIPFILFAIAAFPLQLQASEGSSQSLLEQEAEAIVKQYAGLLKPQLKAAIQAGGFEHAVNICAQQAPEIASRLGTETGWSVKRVSLKARNTSSATPDQYERTVLQQFDQRQQKGEPVASIRHAAIVGKQFRFMRAQGVQGLCLNCHGESINPKVKQVLAQRYPHDLAIDYSLGQIRGAFSLVKDL